MYHERTQARCIVRHARETHHATSVVISFRLGDWCNADQCPRCSGDNSRPCAPRRKGGHAGRRPATHRGRRSASERSMDGDPRRRCELGHHHAVRSHTGHRATDGNGARAHADRRTSDESKSYSRCRNRDPEAPWNDGARGRTLEHCSRDRRSFGRETSRCHLRFSLRRHVRGHSRRRRKGRRGALEVRRSLATRHDVRRDALAVHDSSFSKSVTAGPLSTLP